MVSWPPTGSYWAASSGRGWWCPPRRGPGLQCLPRPSLPSVPAGSSVWPSTSWSRGTWATACEGHGPPSRRCRQGKDGMCLVEKEILNLISFYQRWFFFLQCETGPAKRKYLKSSPSISSTWNCGSDVKCSMDQHNSQHQSGRHQGQLGYALIGFHLDFSILEKCNRPKWNVLECSLGQVSFPSPTGAQCPHPSNKDIR